MRSAQSMSLWEDSPANRSASRANSEARQMIATSGRRCAALFKSTGPLGSWVRTFLASSDWDSTRYSLIWQPMATKQQRLYFRLVPRVRRTYASGYSSWPTARAGKIGGYSSEGWRPTLEQVARAWPTPTSTAGDGRSEQTPEMWQARRDRTLAEKGIHNGIPLNVAVKSWPTPAARDHKGRSGPNHQFAETLSDKVSGALNPDWVESLMGYPTGWTAIDGPLAPAKRSTSGRRHARSRAERPTEPAA